MEHFSTIIEILIVAIFVVAIITIVRYPKDIIRGFFQFLEPSLDRPKSWIFLPVWIVGISIEKIFRFKIYEKDEQTEDILEDPYESNMDLNFDFRNGSKFILSDADQRVLRKLIDKFLTFCNGNYSNSAFGFSDGQLVRIQCPANITLNDFCLLILHLDNSLNTSTDYGLFKSEELNFYLYKDPKSTHNLLGATSRGEKFSIYTLDDFTDKAWLRMNDSLDVRKPDKIIRTLEKS